MTRKTTLAGSGKTKVKIVLRRRFGPLLAIQRREERKLSTLWLLGGSAPELEEPDELWDEDDDEPAPGDGPETELRDEDDDEPTPRDGPETEGGVTAAGVVLGEEVFFGGRVRPDGGSLGIVGSGTTGTRGTGTAVVGGGGSGTGPASAWPPRNPTPATNTNAPAALIHQQLATDGIGSG